LVAHQADLVDDRKALGEVQEVLVEEALMRKANSARELANKALQEYTTQDAGTIVSVLRIKESQFTSLDTTWQIEAQFFLGMAGEMGGRRLEKKVEYLLPEEGEQKELATTLQQLYGLQASALFRFCSPAAQGQVNNVVEMLANMVQGKAPKMPASPSPFIVGVKAKLPLFCMVKGSDGKMLFGKAALLRQLEIIQSTPAQERTLDLYELPTIFAWLLTKPEASELKTSREHALALVCNKGSGASSSSKASGSAAASSSASGSKPVAAEQTFKDAMNMFG
jgi:hypothetical protein